MKIISTWNVNSHPNTNPTRALKEIQKFGIPLDTRYGNAQVLINPKELELTDNHQSRALGTIQQKTQQIRDILDNKLGYSVVSTPIVVSCGPHNKFLVHDGRHRGLAHEELNLPVPAIIIEPTQANAIGLRKLVVALNAHDVVSPNTIDDLVKALDDLDKNNKKYSGLNDVDKRKAATTDCKDMGASSKQAKKAVDKWMGGKNTNLVNNNPSDRLSKAQLKWGNGYSAGRQPGTNIHRHHDIPTNLYKTHAMGRVKALDTNSKLYFEYLVFHNVRTEEGVKDERNDTLKNFARFNKLDKKYVVVREIVFIQRHRSEPHAQHEYKWDEIQEKWYDVNNKCYTKHK